MYSRTILETNFNNLAHNVRVYKSFLKPSTKLLAVVKASGYGAGGVELARFYQKFNADYLAVAFTEEGVELRKNGITIPILVFNPDIENFQDLIKYNLEPTIYDFQQFEKLTEFNTIEFKIHIKLDTGMHRLGFEEQQIKKLISKIKENKNLKVLSIFSHLAASEDKEIENFTNSQIDLFSVLYKEIQVGLGYKPIKHILNSSGIVRYPNAQFDMVRLGIGMHSDDTSGSITSQLKVVHTLKTKIVQIKTINPGEGVGYGVKYKKNYIRKIAIIPLGYADGLQRILGNNKYKIWVNNEFAPIVGTVSMDSCFIDITNIKNINIGDAVEVFGNHTKLQDISLAANTITYEIISGIAPRVKRVYIDSF